MTAAQALNQEPNVMNQVQNFNDTSQNNSSALRALAKRICDDSESPEKFAIATGAKDIYITKLEGFENNY